MGIGQKLMRTDTPPMNGRQIATLPALGLGAASLALVDDAIAREALDFALDSGIRYFDAAPLYGGGAAEERLGRALAGSDEPVFVSTKCGRYRAFGAPPPAVSGIADTWDFSAEATRKSIQRSLDRLGRTRLDAVFLHDIEQDIDGALNRALPVLRDYQAKGVIGMVGAGCNSVAGLIAALQGGADDVLLVAGRWTLLDRTSKAELLPLARRHGTHLVAGGVLNSGMLAGKLGAGPRFDYRAAAPIELDEAQRLRSAAEAAGATLMQAALQFPTRDPGADTLLLGASSKAQLSSALAALREPIPEALWATLQPMGLH